ncbi:phospholipase [Pseudomonas xanthosomatis]|uniref:phospholipase D-like domain-containing protein n=1 Tax=Pseudomonas xanthosomatis TaxID=2842356 RepID=UPI001C3C7CEF|nr:phospholipase D-like domain-containing protein [Pseudomonas xanthosomatis]QXH44620.1 phospholipase [Pseudomonas xanthosomatis]
MSGNPPPYNGVRHKEVTQIISADGRPLKAVSAPDFFIRGANTFAPVRSGNRVRFFTSGKAYYQDLAEAIDQAQASIFITGWQVNHDVLLDGKRSLWQCLRAALKSKPALKVYVLPWLSPMPSLGTHDFETMLAVFHLNVGLGRARAFCLPAIQQSDMKGLGAVFSHHQKSVVVDNQVGYVGGIDLAYGRCDDHRFSLDASARRGRDAYNPCIPHLGWMDMDKHVSRAGLLLATVFDLSQRVPVPLGTSGLAVRVRADRLLNAHAWVRDLIESPAHPAIAWLVKAGSSFKELIGTITHPLEAGKQYLTDAAIRQVAALIRHNWQRLPLAEPLKSQAEAWLQQVEAAQGDLSIALRLQSHLLINQWLANTDLGRMVALVCDKGFDAMPADKAMWLSGIGEAASALLMHLYTLLQQRVAGHQEPYRYLAHDPQPLGSPDHRTLAADQPRMPWQDVHSRIEGPSVYDLSRNFIDRWNGQQAYLAQTPTLYKTDAVIALMEWLNRLARDAGMPYHLDLAGHLQLDLPAPEPVWIDQPEQLPTPPAIAHGQVQVQVLRSASAAMAAQEAKGRSLAKVHLPLPPGIRAQGMQDNCNSAMLQVISSAQHFLYIENQFFQSAFGAQGELNEGQDLSGPMASLRDPGTLREDFVARVKLREALKAQDYGLIDWVELQAICKAYGEEGMAFAEALQGMWTLNAQGWLSHKLGQEKPLENSIAAALADRIGRAIYENRPFHVYLVLPVHPEGKLDVPNVMHQVHLTMQSLVFGELSLVKRIQRHMALKAIMDCGKSRECAQKIIKHTNGKGQPVYEQQDWSRYLTLLNLRTWGYLKGRVVTEQIYVHSKLMIADDRVAILGSANINDRSLNGQRDSELAAIIRDTQPVKAKLDGKYPHTVGKAVHQLRVDLWRKHFGLDLPPGGPVAPFTELADCLDQPAAEHVWRAIQERARANSEAYEKVFDFIPQSRSQVQVMSEAAEKRYLDGFPASIWPTWTYRDALELELGGYLKEPAPHQENFWLKGDPDAPMGVTGFICALPVKWTKGEESNSGFNLTILANRQSQQGAGDVVAQSESPLHKGHHS